MKTLLILLHARLRDAAWLIATGKTYTENESLRLSLSRMMPLIDADILAQQRELERLRDWRVS